MKKYYEILEVNPNASIEIIEKAYKVLARKYHPDLYEGEKKIYAEKKMRDINEAYKILSDEFLREQYDSEIQKENEFENIYYNNSFRYKNTKNKNIKQTQHMNEIENEQKIPKNYIGTYRGLFDVTKAVFKNRPKISIKDFKREDYISIGLTAIIMITLGIILWFIPATNGFIKDMLPFLK